MDTALAGASLVVTDRRWAAPLSAAALGFGIFAGVAIGPGAAGTLATGAQQVIELPGSSEADGQRGGGGGIASTESAQASGGGGGQEEALPPVEETLAPEAVEPLPNAAPESSPAPAPAPEPEDEEPEGEPFEGTVAHLNPAAGSYALALAGGEVVAVHAADLPDPGARLTAHLERLANGAFTETEEPESGKGRASQVELRGVVTFADPDPAAPAYSLSGRGVSLLVHVDPDPSGAAPQPPAIGAYANVTARIEKAPDAPGGSILRQAKLAVEPEAPLTELELAGIVREVVPGGAQVLFSADDSGESEKSLTLAVPASIDTAKLRPGDSYLATATLAGDGSLALTGIAGDERVEGADDEATAQGDLRR